jgi:hypothetical protein
VKAPAGDLYVLQNDGLYRSKPFQLAPATNGKVRLSVTPGRVEKYKLGMYVLGAGGVLTLGGIITLAAGASPDSTFDADGLTHNRNTTALAVGSLLILAGISTGLTGGAWMWDNQHTRVESGAAPATRAAEQPAPPPPAQPPSYQPPPQLGPAPQVSQPAFLLPVFGGAF